jgi:rod shape-determining protein MreC
VVLVGLNAFVLHMVRRQYAPGQSGAALYSLSGQIHEWAFYVHDWKQLTQENSALRDTAAKYTAALAEIQNLQSENDTLRKTANLSTKLKRHVVPAGLFGVTLTPSGYHALLNKGSNDGVMVGQAVVSPEGMLIGKISSVFSSSAQVMLSEDPAFSVTVKVLDGTTSGILRGALSEGLNLELITQSDPISENDTLVTTGDDLIPGGLVAGTVRNVQNNETQLFKKVKVSPAADPSQTGSVAVIER